MSKRIKISDCSIIANFGVKFNAYAMKPITMTYIEVVEKMIVRKRAEFAKVA